MAVFLYGYRIGIFTFEKLEILRFAELALILAPRHIRQALLICVNISRRAVLGDAADTSAREALAALQVGLLYMPHSIAVHLFQCGDIGVLYQELALYLERCFVDIKRLHIIPHFRSMMTSSRGLKNLGAATVFEHPAETISLPSKKLPWAYLPNKPCPGTKKPLPFRPTRA